MLTPEIKTNLILKEIGIKRYSIRSKTTESPQKNLYCYQKGHILALLDKPFENFIEEQQELLKAIIDSTKMSDGEESYEKISYFSKKELHESLLKKFKPRLIIIFGVMPYDSIFDSEYIKAPSLSQLLNKKQLKKDLWINIKQKLSL